jgi:hypothetical protein
MLFAAPSALYRSQPGECDAPFDKAGNTASRGLRRAMTDVFAFASYVSRGPNSNACFPLAAHRLRTRSP